VTSLLVTNDFPPKHGGIQSYLYELWRRLPAGETTVLTRSFEGAAEWDAAQGFRVVRTEERVLWPKASLARRVDDLAGQVGADAMFVDPMLPLGLLGRRLRSAPHLVVVHGAEVTLPGRLPVSNLAARRVLRGAAGIVAAGRYPAREANRAAGRVLQGVVIPPGVDVARFAPPAGPGERAEARSRFGFDASRPLVLGLSRLVPRKGFDVLIESVAGLDDSVVLAIGGAGRDRARLERIANRHGVAGRVRFLGRVADADLPALYGCADVCAMLCRERWGGLEAEGFGIVFVEAAACGVPQVAGRSGGSHEAVVDGETGFVVPPRDVGAVRGALDRLLSDDALRHRLGDASRRRAVADLSYAALVERLRPLAAGDLGALGPLGEAGR